ncbi:MAG: phosphoribosylanthranilate isomerase [Thiotrichaceae bacterium]
MFPNRTRVKICGITRPHDALLAARYGADAIGLVFYAPSPRAITVTQARQILQVLPAFVTSVGLFVNAEPAFVREVLAHIPLDILQFHGEESPEYCQSFARPYIKALRMAPGVDINAVAEHYATAQAILLDTYVAGVQGGTGKTFDWTAIPNYRLKPFILAGGLTPNNVAEAIQAAHPYAVDVSGGVELTKGIKDDHKLAAFMKGINMTTTESHNTYLNMPDSQGHFGQFGGKFVAETLMQPLEELRQAYERYMRDSEFLAELNDDLHHFVGRPSPLYPCAARWSNTLRRGADFKT